ncbi:RNA polymerase sigma factor [Arcicella rigui]|uniref:Sigma-70 family RNA polymerase sigma factor n=1 Tax=Arcicella rigui TaxID=797020 RepID=A0ABU5QAM8_9BACT|nr:sigma-70 family RNA polymerase sigma factor [Arcicella rigui]MEA5139909.1 sigma-70 family RNA polymerase sigma factor [Arcicella rigui]
MKKYYEPSEVTTILRGADKFQIELVTTYLYRTFRPIVKSYIKRQGGDDDVAKDIFQEVILFFSRQVNTLKFEAKSQKEMESYFIKVAHYKWLKKKETDTRRIKREGEYLFENDSSADMSLPSNHIETDELSKENMDAIEKLGERCKCILLAYYVENLSIKEISDMFDFGNPESVKVKKHRCIQKLKEQMKYKKQPI